MKQTRTLAGPLSRRGLLLAAAQLSAQTDRNPSGDPHFWTLCEAADQIRNRKISSAELTELSLERIRQGQEKLNAFITVTADAALAKARSFDRDLHRGLLHGVPIALKDNIDTAGVRTTAASQIFEGRVPVEGAEVAKRVFQAGAVSLGKLNLDEFAFEGTGTTAISAPSTTPGISHGSPGDHRPVPPPRWPRDSVLHPWVVMTAARSAFQARTAASSDSNHPSDV